MFQLGEGEFALPFLGGIIVDEDMITGLVFTLEQALAQLVLDPALQETAQRASAIVSIVANVGQVLGGGFAQFSAEAQLDQAAGDVIHEQHDNSLDFRLDRKSVV